MLESVFQADTVNRIKKLLPGVRVLKNDSGYQQGIPDFSIFLGSAWAWLEFKRSANERQQPNQEFFIDWASQNAFGAFIYPENRDEVLKALVSYFDSRDYGKIW